MAHTPDYSADINFLYEMGSIRYMERMWRRFGRADFANLAEHHFRVFWIAMAIAAREKNVDTGKVAKMALMHDIAESRTGDVDYLARQYVERNEELGISDMLAGTSLENEYASLIKEYETRSSIEAKIVKDADNLDVDFELREQAVHGGFPLYKKWAPMRDQVFEKKLTKTAKTMYQQLKNSDPHEWHISGRTRYQSGDWKLK